jgi:hypothetical protein
MPLNILIGTSLKSKANGMVPNPKSAHIRCSIKVNFETFRIEKILKTRKVGEKTQHLVRWKGFNSDYDSWIDSTDITNEF